DRAGRALVYLRHAASGLEAVVRDLATGTERHVRAPAGHRLLGAQIDREGAWLWIWSAPASAAVRAHARLGGVARQCDPPWTPRTHEGLPAPAGGTIERRAVALDAIDEPAWIEGAGVAL